MDSLFLVFFDWNPYLVKSLMMTWLNFLFSIQIQSTLICKEWLNVWTFCKFLKIRLDKTHSTCLTCSVSNLLSSIVSPLLIYQYIQRECILTLYNLQIRTSFWTLLFLFNLALIRTLKILTTTYPVNHPLQDWRLYYFSLFIYPASLSLIPYLKSLSLLLCLELSEKFDVGCGGLVVKSHFEGVLFGPKLWF